MPSSAWKKDVCSRSEEHTSELQSLTNLVCRLLLDKNDFPRFRAIADEVGAQLVVYMGHIAGLVTAFPHPSPGPCSDAVLFFFNKPPPPELSPLPLCNALPI